MSFEEFSKFIRDFQEEVQLTEFEAYSSGNKHILAEDFVDYLLWFTDFSPEELRRCKARVKDKKLADVSLQDFALFNAFLNRLNDFEVAVKFHLFAGQPLTQSVFKRAAAICLNGKNLPDHLIHSIFAVFDATGESKSH